MIGAQTLDVVKIVAKSRWATNHEGQDEDGMADSCKVWRTRLAVTGFLLSVAGLLITVPVLRLSCLLILAIDFGMKPVEAIGVPVSVVAAVFCLIGPKNGAAAWLSRVGLLLAVIGLLMGILITAAILSFDGGSV